MGRVQLRKPDLRQVSSGPLGQLEGPAEQRVGPFPPELQAVLEHLSLGLDEAHGRPRQLGGLLDLLDLRLLGGGLPLEARDLGSYVAPEALDRVLFERCAARLGLRALPSRPGSGFPQASGFGPSELEGVSSAIRLQRVQIQLELEHGLLDRPDVQGLGQEARPLRRDPSVQTRGLGAIARQVVCLREPPHPYAGVLSAVGKSAQLLSPLILARHQVVQLRLFLDAFGLRDERGLFVGRQLVRRGEADALRRLARAQRLELGLRGCTPFFHELPRGKCRLSGTRPEELLEESDAIAQRFLPLAVLVRGGLAQRLEPLLGFIECGPILLRFRFLTVEWATDQDEKNE